ncbi:MAG: DUF3301 domain-containing protein [Pseudomonadota bacterium]
MSLIQLFIFLVLGIGVWFVLDSLKVREIAIHASRAACNAENFLFLDDTVAIESTRPARDDRGQLRIRRVYNFEYSDTGNNRRQGTVILVGNIVVTVYVGLTIVPAANSIH